MPRPNKDYSRVYQYYMDKTQVDPVGAGSEYLEALRKQKLNPKVNKTIEQLERILDGDESAWQYGAKSQREAIQLLISNSIMSGMGLGVIKPGMESVLTIANMISEDINYIPLTAQQKQMKILVESYGFVAYAIQPKKHFI